MKIYLASSWKNETYDSVYEALSKSLTFKVYNFKDDAGFHWSETLGPDWINTPLNKFIEILRDDPRVEAGFIRDQVALESASATVLVLPCGRSAHLELGVAIGRGQYTAIFTLDHFEPELMYKYVNLITDDLQELYDALDEYDTSQWNKTNSLGSRRRRR